MIRLVSYTGIRRRRLGEGASQSPFEPFLKSIVRRAALYGVLPRFFEQTKAE